MFSSLQVVDLRGACAALEAGAAAASEEAAAWRARAAAAWRHAHRSRPPANRSDLVQFSQPIVIVLI